MKLINHITLPCSLQFTYPLPISIPLHMLYLLKFLSFIINPQNNVWQGFLMYPYCDYSLLWSVQPLPLLSLTPSLPHPLFNSFQYILSYPLPAQMEWISIFLTIIIFSFPFFPELHRIVSLLQKSSTYKIIYDNLWFSIYVHFLVLSSTYDRKCVAFIFLKLSYLNLSYHVTFLDLYIIQCKIFLHIICCTIDMYQLRVPVNK
jgi:hypothetical protein